MKYKHSDWVNSVAFSPDSKTLVSGSRNMTIKLWRCDI
ncbi:WD40 repeat domain-containing protein [Nostoc sp.]